jgi:hypothetical protein
MRGPRQRGAPRLPRRPSHAHSGAPRQESTPAAAATVTATEAGWGGRSTQTHHHRRRRRRQRASPNQQACLGPRPSLLLAPPRCLQPRASRHHARSWSPQLPRAPLPPCHCRACPCHRLREGRARARAAVAAASAHRLRHQRPMCPAGTALPVPSRRAPRGARSAAWVRARGRAVPRGGAGHLRGWTPLLWKTPGCAQAPRTPAGCGRPVARAFRGQRCLGTKVFGDGGVEEGTVGILGRQSGCWARMLVQLQCCVGVWGRVFVCRYRREAKVQQARTDYATQHAQAHAHAQ